MLPVRTPAETWQLLAIVAKPGSDMTTAADQLLRRAQAEASATTANADRLTLLFDRWLRMTRAAQAPGATDQQNRQCNSLADKAIAIPISDPLDIWRKVAWPST